KELTISPKTAIARAWVCEPESQQTSTEQVLYSEHISPIPLSTADIKTGPLDQKSNEQLVLLLQKYRNCFAQDLHELGKAKSATMAIRLTSDNPVTYRPYRMSLQEREKDERPNIQNVEVARTRAAAKIKNDQLKQKIRFDSKRKLARVYNEGDLVVKKKQFIGDTSSHKLIPSYAGPFQVQQVLPNDRYVVGDMEGSTRSKYKQRRTRTGLRCLDESSPRRRGQFQD
ncbi:hypothetical protein CBL_21305, partial [Carabus blaptoides fortunei]